MKTINDLIKGDDPAQSIGFEQPERGESSEDRLMRERVMDRLWLRLSEIYGSSLVSQYGETIPESWELLLMEVTPEQIKDGLNALATRENVFPPNAAEFRQLCMPATISPNGGNAAAYLSLSDPRHPNHRPKLLESDHRVSKRKKAGRAALDELRGIFPRDTCPSCKTEDPKFKHHGAKYCNEQCADKFDQKIMEELASVGRKHKEDEL